MAERRRHNKDAKFWAQAVGEGVLERRPHVGTTHLSISGHGIEQTRLIRFGGLHSEANLDAAANTLHLPYGSSAGVEIVAAGRTQELVAVYVAVKNHNPARIIIRTGGKIKVKFKSGHPHPWIDGEFSAALDPYSDSEVRINGLLIRSVTDIL